MSYDNAEPKVLKTLNSDGQVLDDAGNVINDTSDYWVQLYNQTEPKVDKILKSDGTIVDSAGNLIQDTTEFNVKKYNQAEPIPAKYLHADGTIDENPGSGSGADLEDNHQTTIDVSTYTQPVEVTPISGKDGMKKNTITLDNIPAGANMLYAWECTTPTYSYMTYFDFNVAPQDVAEWLTRKQITTNISDNRLQRLRVANNTSVNHYEKTSDTEFFIVAGQVMFTFTRSSENDITLWS